MEEKKPMDTNSALDNLITYDVANIEIQPIIVVTCKDKIPKVTGLRPEDSCVFEPVFS